MKKLLLILGILFVSYSVAFSQNCAENALEVQPSLPVETRKDFEAKLDEARKQFEKSPNESESIIWLGRRTAYLGKYKEAIKIFTNGIEKFPTDARFYRHRGHRFITLRCFGDAIKDFESAAKLVKGKADEIEPDGLPNARNIPTGTLQSNIFYHLGLAYYLKGDFKRALKAYRKAEKVSANPDMLVATTHWLYMTLRRLGKEKEARKAIEPIKDNLDIIENVDYYKLVKIYRGTLKTEELLKEMGAESKTLSNASLGYGLGNWFLYNDGKGEAVKIFREITNGNQWASFGYIAAEAELKRLSKSQVVS